MSSAQWNVLNLSNCPDLIIEHIFSYLTFEQRKTASLVCRFWHQRAFGSHFLKSTELKLIPVSYNPVYLHSRMESHYLMLTNSSRRYQHLVADFDYRDANWLEKYLDLIGDSLISFRNIEPIPMSMLRMIVSKASHLETLDVYLDQEYQTQPTPLNETLPSLRMLISDVTIMQIHVHAAFPNLQHLMLSSSSFDESLSYVGIIKDALVSFGPQLRSLDVDLTAAVVSDITQNISFPQLEVLRIRNAFRDYNNIQGNFFNRFTHLKQCIVVPSLHSDVLDSITRSCPSIEVFDFYIKDRWDDRAVTFLERLKSLRELGIAGQMAANTWRTVSSLPTVRKLSLGGPSYDSITIQQLAKLLPNVVELEACGEWRQVAEICLRFNAIKRLTLDCIEWSNNEPALKVLPKVETLVLFRNESLRFLTLDLGGAVLELLESLQDIFPNLIQLEILDCSTPLELVKSRVKCLSRLNYRIKARVDRYAYHYDDDEYYMAQFWNDDSI